MINKLGHVYIHDNNHKVEELLKTSKPMNTYGLYIQPHDIQRYIRDYH